jgi:hypothetical protein
MNHAKIAAALHALADAFLEGAVADESPAKPAKGKKAAAEQPATATAATAASATATAATATAAPAAAQVPPPAEPEVPPVPPVPSITKAQLNAAVLKVAAKSRDLAEAILARFGAKNTVTLPEDKWQAVYDAFEEEIAKIDAAAVQVAQASLV